MRYWLTLNFENNTQENDSLVFNFFVYENK